MQDREVEPITKPSLSSDRRLQLACVKSESLVNADQHAALNTFPGLVHTARHVMKVDTLIDTRSYPFSKYAFQFNQDSLKRVLEQNAIKYLFLGKELGGRPKDPTFYDEDGHVLYWKVAASRDFQFGIEQLLNHITKSTVALLCSEENPSNCHRRLLIGRVLKSYGVCIKHIRGNGTVQLESELEILNSAGVKQLNIFSPQNEEKTWRSIQSVLQKNHCSIL